MSTIRTLAALVILAAPAAAQTAARHGRAASVRPPAAGVASSDEEKVEAIFARFYEAQGSVYAMARLQTRIMRGYVTHSKSTHPGTVEYYAKAPNKTIMVLNVPGAGQFLGGYDGDAAWFQTPFGGAFVFDQNSTLTLDREAEFRRKKAREMFASVKYKGRGEVEGRAVDIVEAVRAGKPPVTLYFELKTGLLARSDAMMPPRAEGEKGVQVTAIIDRCATVDGVTLPISFRFIYPTHTMTYKLYEIKHNVPIDDSMFDRPTPSKPAK